MSESAVKLWQMLYFKWSPPQVFAFYTLVESILQAEAIIFSVGWRVCRGRWLIRGWTLPDREHSTFSLTTREIWSMQTAQNRENSCLPCEATHCRHLRIVLASGFWGNAWFQHWHYYQHICRASLRYHGCCQARARDPTTSHPPSDVFLSFHLRVYLHTSASAVSPFLSLSFVCGRSSQLIVALHSFLSVLGKIVLDPLEIRQPCVGPNYPLFCRLRSASDRCLYTVAGMFVGDSNSQR